jgi:phospholipid/cholesterol/gamma-HCH transport system substrate-binding protein
METRAPFVLIGLFVISAIVSAFGFVYWFKNTGGLTARVDYEIRFENTVSGLLKGSAVWFNGVRVGEVVELRLDPDALRQVIAIIAVAAETPIRADTYVTLDFQGLTGVPVIVLEGRSATPAPPDPPPVLKADPAAGINMTQAARNSLVRLDNILAENSQSLHDTIANLNAFSAALGRNSDRVDGIVSAVERLTGAGSGAASSVIYDLNAPRDFPAVPEMPSWQLTVPEPTAVVMYDTQRILVRPSGSEDASFATAKWSDNIPQLLQARIIQTFENAGLMRVRRGSESQTGARQLLIDIRAFQLALSAAPQAEVEFSAKLVTDDGNIINGRVFHTTFPARSADAAGAAVALDEAFQKAAIELVLWATEAG